MSQAPDNYSFAIRSQVVARRAALSIAILMAMTALLSATRVDAEERLKFRRIPTQFIAALGDPAATSGSGAQTWGLWHLDPGPRGVWLNNYQQQLIATGGVAPTQWRFDLSDWWLDENGLIMEQPKFSIPPGKYLVTGNREVTSVLTIYPENENGDKDWDLAKGASLYDVTHLACRSARYTPVASKDSCSPDNAPRSAFRVTPGAAMPPVSGCHKQDYAVLFVVGVEVES